MAPDSWFSPKSISSVCCKLSLSAQQYLVFALTQTLLCLFKNTLTLMHLNVTNKLRLKLLEVQNCTVCSLAEYNQVFKSSSMNFVKSPEQMEQCYLIDRSKLKMSLLATLCTVLHKSNTNVFCQNSQFIFYIKFLTETIFRGKDTIILSKFQNFWDTN